MTDNHNSQSSEELPTAKESEKDEPRSWFRQIWDQARERFYGSAETAELREALENLIIETANDKGGAATAESLLLKNFIKFHEVEVADCMVPRADIIAIDVNTDMKLLVDIMAEHTHSRIPAYRGTLDETLGMVHMKDVMACLAHGRTSEIRELLRPVLFVPPSMPASRLLAQMRQARQHMAMVVDEFGSIDGLVTIEDIVEQLVGEIEDEHDDPETISLVRRSDGSLLAEGRLEIHELEKHVGPLLSNEERETIDTIGGYVLHLAAHVPQIGETICGPSGLSFEVLETEQSRIKRVRVRGLPPKE